MAMWSNICVAPYFTPLRAKTRCGALVMLSMPPATTTEAEPAASMSWPNIIARMPEPHILLSVTAPALCARPALSAAWRAGAWPWPAIRQLPISTSSTASGARPARSTAAWMATPPSSAAGSAAKSPSRPPMGVRAAETMTMGSDMTGSPGGKAQAAEVEVAAARRRALKRRSGS